MARLLLLDNDERIVELLSWFLRDRGFEVDVAESFAVARGRIAAARPDLLVSDVDLGTETAVEELPRLSAEGILPPTLVVSGFLDEAVEGRLRAVPEVLDTLPKPFEFNELEERIRHCLEEGDAWIAEAEEREGGAAAPAS
ncbi:MAG: response regulator, partial [Planctomycetota bacterium]|nr:response regulator [Planctomycetota bacterium]